jgi:outer membrane protein
MQMRAESDISNEKEKLYEPILAKADSIVKQIGKENGYTFIYDAAALLYADTTLNILPLVKERMGIK